MTVGSEKVTKLEAARRQMVEAIVLHFQRRDRIAIHTLALCGPRTAASAGGFFAIVVCFCAAEVYRALRSVVSRCNHVVQSIRNAPYAVVHHI